MAYAELKNQGLLFSETTDFSKTRSVPLAAEKIGKDLYRQVLHVTFFDKSGGSIEVIIVSEASHEECSMSDVETYVVSRHFGELHHELGGLRQKKQ